MITLRYEGLTFLTNTKSVGLVQILELHAGRFFTKPLQGSDTVRIVTVPVQHANKGSRRHGRTADVVLYEDLRAFLVCIHFTKTKSSEKYVL
jgi:hypothetical protein